MKKYFYLLPLVLFFGCENNSSTTSSTDDSTDTVSISGSVNLSDADSEEFTPSSSLNLNISGLNSKTLIRNAILETATATLYSIEENGDFVDTGITSTVVDGEYNFENISDNKKYVVEITRNGFDSNNQEKTLKLKTIVNPTSETEITANIDTKSTLVSDLMIDKAYKTSGGSSSKSLDNELQAEIDDLIESSLDTSAISLLEDSTLVSENPDAISNASNLEIIDSLQNDSSILRTLKQVRIDSNIKRESLSITNARKIILQVFGIEGSTASNSGFNKHDTEDIPILPDFFIDSFAEGYIEDKEITISQIARSYFENTVEEANPYDSEAELSAALVDFLDTNLTSLYDVYDENETDDDSLPIYLRVIFSNSNRIDLPVTSAQVLSVPQAIFLIEESGIMEAETETGSAVDEIGFCQDLDLVDIIEGESYFIFNAITPIKYPFQGGENTVISQALDARTEIYNSIEVPTRVTLTYPTVNGNVTVDMVEDDGYDEINQTAWGINPYSNPEDETQFINDFITGTATITVYNESAEEIGIKTFSLVNADIPLLEWVSQNQMDSTSLNGEYWEEGFEPETISGTPIYQWQFVDDEEPVIPDGYTLKYIVSVGYTASPIDYDTEEELPDDIELPEGLGDSWDIDEAKYKWRYIYSSLVTGNYISAQKFDYDLDYSTTQYDEENNYQTTYEVNVTPVLINSSAGSIVWRGEEARTNFYYSE